MFGVLLEIVCVCVCVCVSVCLSVRVHKRCINTRTPYGKQIDLSRSRYLPRVPRLPLPIPTDSYS